MRKIGLLPHERWKELEQAFDERFDAALPEAGQANIVAAFDDENKVTGFLVAETLIRIGQIAIFGNESPLLTKKLIDYTERNLPKGVSCIVIASEERFESLIRRYGCREVEGKLFRRDL